MANATQKIESGCNPHRENPQALEVRQTTREGIGDQFQLTLRNQTQIVAAKEEK